jgi:outer membrane protein assembly factor BamB
MHGVAETWDVKTGRNLLWSARLGSHTYGSPVVAGGKVFIGTNNDGKRNPSIQGDKGILLALSEADGKLLWQAITDKLTSENDWPQIGICSSPLVEGDRLYYVTSRGELVALDTEGFLDKENDGPFREETATSPTDADVVWKLDMRSQLGVVARFATANSPVSYGDLLFINTSNGIDREGKPAAPRAPSFLAVNKQTGKVVWSDASPSAAVMAGQWSSPAIGVVGGVPQVIFGGGDGWLYAFQALTGEPLWRFDANADAGPNPAARGYFVATPVFYEDKVLVGIGRDPQDGAGPGRFWALDATRHGDITHSGVLWRYDKLGRTLSTAAVADGLVYIADFGGLLHCLDLKTGQPYWTHDMLADVWGSPLVVDGRVYLVDEDGEVEILRAGRKREVLGTINLGEAAYSTPVPAKGKLLIATSSQLFAIAPELMPGKKTGGSRLAGEPAAPPGHQCPDGVQEGSHPFRRAPQAVRHVQRLNQVLVEQLAVPHHRAAARPAGAVDQADGDAPEAAALVRAGRISSRPLPARVARSMSPWKRTGT